MRQAKNVKPGDVVRFPHTCFAPYRSGWNGWVFKVAIVDRLYTSKTGKPCAKITYCDRIGVDPWEPDVVLEYSEKQIGIGLEKLFELSKTIAEHLPVDDAEFMKRHAVVN